MKLRDKLLQKTLKRFGAGSVFELNRIFSRAEQPLFVNGGWNYNNSCLLFNKIKSALERLPDDCFKGDDLVWKRETLWLWYHHAISIAIGHREIKAARRFANTAIALQERGHPNKITRLLWHLVHGRIRQAKRWFREGVKGPDKKTARDVLSWYKEGYFSSNQERRKKYAKNKRQIPRN